MSFLAPLFIVGAALIGAPILLHLIRRATRQKVPFSSLMFLDPSPPRITRRSRIENLPLLLLRCLAIVLLALAFARPFVQQPAEAVTGDAAARRVVLLIDTSASMRRESLWTQALDRAQRTLRQLTPHDQLCVIAFDRRPRTIISFQQWRHADPAARPALARQSLAALSPTFHDTDFGAALVFALETLEEAALDDAAVSAIVGGSVVLVSDMQSGGRVEAIRGHEWPAGVDLSIETLKAASPTNASLQQLIDEHQSLTGEPPLRLRVAASADAKREQFHVASADHPAESVYVPPGQGRVVRLPAAPHAGAVVTLTGDDHPFDNTLYIAPHPPQVTRVLYLGAQGPDDATQPLYYLQRALQPTRSHLPQLLTRAPTSLGPADLVDCDLLVITGPLPEPQLAEVRRWIEAGHTAAVVCRDIATAATLAPLTGRNIEAHEAAGENYAMLTAVDLKHPLMAPFADPRFSDFTGVHFWKHRRLTGPGLDDAARVVARFDSGDPAILSIDAGKGQLLVFTSSWEPADSQLALSSRFVPLVYSLLQQAGPSAVATHQHIVDDHISLRHLLAPGAPPAVVLAPGGRRVEISAAAPVFEATDEPGLYTIQRGAEMLGRFAVNIAPTESQTAPLTIEQLEQLGLPLAPPPAAAHEAKQQEQQRLVAVELENRQKLWRWIIVAALGVLLIETAMAGAIARRTAQPAGTQP